MAITHAKVSAIEDGDNEDLVRPSDWNADHEGTATPSDIDDFLENPPTEDEAHKAPTSEYMFDHNAAAAGVHGVGSDYVAKSKSSSLFALNAPTGTSWENRTYKSYEILDTPTTYTIGSGQDFETLAACATSLQGLILIADITIQLEEAITLTETVTFKGLISAGGGVYLDLNGHDITINHNATGIIASGPFNFYPRDKSSAPYNSIIAGANAGASTYLLYYTNFATGTLYHLNLDANSKAIIAMLYANLGANLFVHSNTVFLDTGAGGLYTRALQVKYSAHVSASVILGVAADDLLVDTGSMIIDSDGHIHTEAGEFTP